MTNKFMAALLVGLTLPGAFAHGENASVTNNQNPAPQNVSPSDPKQGQGLDQQAIEAERWGFGRGWGRGYGRGWGRGYGWGRGWGYGRYPWGYGYGHGYYGYCYFHPYLCYGYYHGYHGYSADDASNTEQPQTQGLACYSANTENNQQYFATSPTSKDEAAQAALNACKEEATNVNSCISVTCVQPDGTQTP